MLRRTILELGGGFNQVKELVSPAMHTLDRQLGQSVTVAMAVWVWGTVDLAQEPRQAT